MQFTSEHLFCWDMTVKMLSYRKSHKMWALKFLYYLPLKGYPKKGKGMGGEPKMPLLK